jgi:hypothetical protein
MRALIPETRHIFSKRSAMWVVSKVAMQDMTYPSSVSGKDF